MKKQPPTIIMGLQMTKEEETAFVAQPRFMCMLWKKIFENKRDLAILNCCRTGVDLATTEKWRGVYEASNNMIAELDVYLNSNL